MNAITLVVLVSAKILVLVMSIFILAQVLRSRMSLSSIGHKMNKAQVGTTFLGSHEPSEISKILDNNSTKEGLARSQKEECGDGQTVRIKSILILNQTGATNSSSL